MKVEVKVLRDGVISRIVLEAPNPHDAERQAKNQGLAVLDSQVQSRLAWRPRSKGGGFSLVLFSQQLLILLESGLSLVEAIEALSEREGGSDSGAILAGVMAALYQGRTLSSALEGLPEAFPPLYVALIRASERTSNLAETLSQHVAYLSQMEAVRKKVVSASIYPTLLLVVGLLVIAFLLGYVVPRFSALFENGGSNLPLISRVLLAWGRLLQEHGYAVAFCVIGGVAAVVHQLSREVTRKRILNVLWRLPFIRETLRVYQLSRCFRTLGMLLRGGIPLVTGMDMVASLLHPSLRDAFARVQTEVREGKPLAHSMDLHGLTTPISLRMLRVGERTGRLGEMMERISVFHDDEISRMIDWMTRLFEPILMTVIGVVIGVIVALLYMPIFDLAGTIQ